MGKINRKNNPLLVRHVDGSITLLGAIKNNEAKDRLIKDLKGACVVLVITNLVLFYSLVYFIMKG